MAGRMPVDTPLDFSRTFEKSFLPSKGDCSRHSFCNDEKMYNHKTRNVFQKLREPPPLSGSLCEMLINKNFIVGSYVYTTADMNPVEINLQNRKGKKKESNQ